MDNSKFLKIVIIILLFINISTLAFIWMHKPPHAMPPPPSQEIGDFLMHELNFTEAQRTQFVYMRDEHRSSVRDLRDESQYLRDKFFDLLDAIPPDTIKIYQLADSLTSVQKQIELSTFYHFQKVRTICSPRQQKKFDEVIKEGLRMLTLQPPSRR